MSYQNRASVSPSFGVLLLLLCVLSLFAQKESSSLVEYIRQNSNFIVYEEENRLNRVAGDVKKTRDMIYNHLDENIKKVLTLPENMSIRARGDFNHVRVDFIYRMY